MTDTKTAARDASKLVDEIDAVVLTDPSDLLPDPKAADKPTAEAIAKAIAEIDMHDTNSIVSFGSAAQAELQVISQAMLDGVRNKDVGPAGASLRDIVGTIRGFSVEELDPTTKSVGGIACLAAPSPCMISLRVTKPCKVKSTRSPMICCGMNISSCVTLSH